ncbi:hypothetical protein D3C77_565220 [compost metagenome]
MVIVAIDNGGNASVGVDLQILGRLLLPVGETERMHLVGQAQLLEGDGHLEAVGGIGRIQINHGCSPLTVACSLASWPAQVKARQRLD